MVSQVGPPSISELNSVLPSQAVQDVGITRGLQGATNLHRSATNQQTNNHLGYDCFHCYTLQTLRRTAVCPLLHSLATVPLR